MRLIDADAMRKDWLENGQNEYVYDTNAVLYSIDEQPTIDAVEVVRCGLCRYEGTGDCPMSGTPGMVSASDFCSYGERRSE